MRRGLDGFREDADAWRAAVGARVPVYDRLLEAAAAMFEQPSGSLEEAARARVEAAWRERRYKAGYDRPLLLMAALRAEALRAGTRHPLHAAIAAPEVNLEAATRPTLAAALADAPPRLFVDLATRHVQTNETSRAVTWLWPAALLGCTGGHRPLALYDLGCSAGLNLVGNRLSLSWTDLADAPIPVATDASIVARHGFDAHPLDVGREDDLTWLRACIWPGENIRLARLERAVTEFLPARPLSPEALLDTRGGPYAWPRLEAADLTAVPARLETLAADNAPQTLLLAYQTVVRDYLPDAVRASYVEGMTRWVAAGPASGPTRVWIELESVGDAWKDPTGLPMAIEAHIADGAGGTRTLRLARCSYHPDRLAPDRVAVEELVAHTK
jgi:hypothetical protein